MKETHCTTIPYWLKALVQGQRSFKTMRVLFVLLGFVAVHAATVRSTEQLNENPIRRIVNLLQMMAKEIETDGEKDEEMHEKCTAHSRMPRSYRLDVAAVWYERFQYQKHRLAPRA